MGSQFPPGHRSRRNRLHCYDEIELRELEEALAALWQTLAPSVATLGAAEQDEMKTALAERVMALAESGITERNEIIRKALAVTSILPPLAAADPHRPHRR